MGHSVVVRARALRLVLSGLNNTQAARVMGMRRETLDQWSRAEGLSFTRGRYATLTSECRVRAVAALERMCGVDPRTHDDHDPNAYTDSRGHLTECARGVIFHMLMQDKGQAEIAREIGVNRTTICRELQRNGGRDSYVPQQAQQRAVKLKARPKPFKLASGCRLRAHMVAGLNRRDSPEQISAGLAIKFPDDEQMNIAHETIYQALYVKTKGALRHELTVEKALRSGRVNRRPRSKLPRRSNSTWIGPEATITERPAEVEDRAVPGHWEGDLVLGKGNQTALITLVERTSRFVLIRRLPDKHDATTVSDELIEMVKDLPEHLRKTLTWDRGREMATHVTFSMATDTKVYFCDPYSPWQRGSNENTNLLIRDFYPKGTDFATVTDEEIQSVQDNLNTRIRKTLQWKTPAATLNTYIDVAMTT